MVLSVPFCERSRCRSLPGPGRELGPLGVVAGHGLGLLAPIITIGERVDHFGSAPVLVDDLPALLDRHHPDSVLRSVGRLTAHYRDRWPSQRRLPSMAVCAPVTDAPARSVPGRRPPRTWPRARSARSPAR